MGVEHGNKKWNINSNYKKIHHKYHLSRKMKENIIQPKVSTCGACDLMTFVQKQS